ncbi:glycoside hydrolase family protein [Sphingobacterium bambusae]|uniref:Sialidase domain-containing protein n=1 Tax=Sphingobacterium bambusae TaxID=662858 RepID=A0ABW6BKJ1_9SPHI|nr:hypothetical protein [Sphingobacterium bambusae]WPL49431.1 hypothetical protein SCB77_03055 [Sphingobacterium bambusae]
MMKKCVSIFFVSLLAVLFSHAQQTPILIDEGRSYEVDAILTSKGDLIAVWMGDRPDVVNQGRGIKDVAVYYATSTDTGKTWVKKSIIDFPNSMITANPKLAMDDNGEVYLTLMSVDHTFFSSRLELFKYDVVRKKFSHISQPFSSTSALLDKPSLVVRDGIFELTYVIYTSGMSEGRVLHQQSVDGGKSWSSAIDISPKSNILFLGASTKISKDNLLFSVGSFHQDSVYFAIQKAGRLFQNKDLSFHGISEISSELGAAMTELETGNKDDMVISIQKNHQLGGLYVLCSNDAGTTWTSPVCIADTGFLLSTAIGSNSVLHTSYFIKDNVGIKFIYEQYNISELCKPKSERKIKVSQSVGYTDYIGAFQKILIHGDSKQILLFWIDYGNGNILKMSKIP